MSKSKWSGGLSKIKKYFFKFKNCNVKDFDYNVKDTFYNIKLNQFFCPTINETTNFTLEGLYTDDYFKFIEIIFRLNNYSKNNLEELKEFMINYPVEMIIYIMDSSIDYENRLNPISKYINEINKWLDFENRKETQISISDIDFEDDQHYYINSINKSKLVFLDSNYDSFRFINRHEIIDNDILGTFIIRASQRKIKFKRIYQKFPSFIAEISGVIECAYLIMFFIVRFLDKNLIDKKIIKKMIKYRGNNRFNLDYLKILNNKEEKIKFEQMNNNKFLNNENKIINNKIDLEDNINDNNNNEYILSSQRTFNNNEINNKKVKYQNYLNTYKVYTIKKNKTNENVSSFNYKYNTFNAKNSNIKFINYFNKKLLDIEKEENKKENIKLYNLALYKLCFCICNSKNKVKYKIIQNYINYYLDIFIFINKIQELDLIKNILFENNNQNLLFEYLSKPIINFYENNLKDLKIKKYKKKDYENLYNIYKELNLKNNINIFEFKLLELFKKEIEY